MYYEMGRAQTKDKQRPNENSNRVRDEMYQVMEQEDTRSMNGRESPSRVSWHESASDMAQRQE